jgi:Family of unknown function (DUF6932)
MMPIPTLDRRGLLPMGLHPCTLEEIREEFGGFQGSDIRPRLFEALRSYVAEARSSAVVAWLVVDGSFVTGKQAPGDIDLLVVLPSDHDFSGMLRPAAYNVVSRRRVRKSHGFDILVAAERTPEFDQYLAFFQEVKDEPGLRKGILRVDL